MEPLSARHCTEPPNMKRSWRIKALWIEPLWPVLLGSIAFVLVVGPRAIRPDNIGWLWSSNSEPSDLSQGFLGWQFFRNSPWALPPGANPDYGLEFSSGILYSDSIPLLAFLFKPFARWLPESFQYFGLWVFLCYILQAWFAWKLVGAVSDSAVLKLCSVGLFLFAPPFLYRMNRHLSLLGPWTILSALYLNFIPNISVKRLAWPALIFATALVHTYLLAMVLALWMADSSRRALCKEDRAVPLAFETGLALALPVLALWTAGFFMVGDAGRRSPDGPFYGRFRINYLSFIDPRPESTNAFEKYSYVLPDMPGLPGDSEGFNFLGLGGLVVCLAAIPPLFSFRKTELDRRWLPLGAVLTGLTLFAMSNRIGIGQHELVLPARPHRLYVVAEYLRSSGRMAWPLFYTLVWGASGLVARGYGRRTAVTVLAAASILQIADTHAGWKGIKPSIAAHSGTSWPSPLASRFWTLAPKHYRKVRVVPPGVPPYYAPVAYYAATHGMATDAAYLARYDSQRICAATNTAESALRRGAFEKDSLYIIDEKNVKYIFNHISEDDLFDRIDGYYVLAPGWKRIEGRDAVHSGPSATDLAPAFSKVDRSPDPQAP